MGNINNQVLLIGNLGKEVELIRFETGRSKAKLTLATNDYYKNVHGDTITETQWHTLVAWGRVAENMAKLLTVGDEVTIQGKLMHRKYLDAEGRNRFISEVLVSGFRKYGRKSDKSDRHSLISE